MALISCPDCGNNTVSDTAPACPVCGRPMPTEESWDDSAALLEPPEQQARPRVQLIEQTGKGYKLGMVVGVCLAIGGCVGSCNATDRPDAAAMLMFAFIGCVVFTASKILAWWHHG